MPEIIAVGLAAMQQDMQRMEHVAMNLANALTPGYKRQIAVVHPFAGVVDRLQAQGTGQAVDLGAAVQTFVDVKAGALKSTGQSLDLAIDGEGFFEIATESGPAYTRQGNFHVDVRGRLVNAQGLPVMGSNGEIMLAQAKPHIDQSGNIFDGKSSDLNALVSKLKVTVFDEPGSMQSLGNGLLTAGNATAQPAQPGVRVRQGFLETANVSTQQEMIQLMQTTRHFESMQKAVQGYDELIGMAIHKLGEV